MQKSSLYSIFAGIFSATTVFGIRAAIEYGPMPGAGWVAISAFLIIAINFAVMSHQHNYIHVKNPNES